MSDSGNDQLNGRADETLRMPSQMHMPPYPHQGQVPLMVLPTPYVFLPKPNFQYLNTGYSQHESPNSTRTNSPAPGMPYSRFASSIGQPLLAKLSQPDPLSLNNATTVNMEQRNFPTPIASPTISVSYTSSDPIYRKRRNSTPLPRLYACDYEGCEKTFTQMSHLRIHMRKHLNVRPHPCPFSAPPHSCTKSFTQLGNLRTHIRSHTGEKPYTCSACGRGFSQLGNLRTHEDLHKGLKRWVCEVSETDGRVCNKRFGQGGNLRSHIRKVHHLDPRSLHPVEGPDYSSYTNSSTQVSTTGSPAGSSHDGEEDEECYDEEGDIETLALPLVAAKIEHGSMSHRDTPLAESEQSEHAHFGSANISRMNKPAIPSRSTGPAALKRKRASAAFTGNDDDHEEEDEDQDVNMNEDMDTVASLLPVRRSTRKRTAIRPLTPLDSDFEEYDDDPTDEADSHDKQPLSAFMKNSRVNFMDDAERERQDQIYRLEMSVVSHVLRPISPESNLEQPNEVNREMMSRGGRRRRPSLVLLRPKEIERSEGDDSHRNYEPRRNLCHEEVDDMEELRDVDNDDTDTECSTEMALLVGLKRAVERRRSWGGWSLNDAGDEEEC